MSKKIFFEALLNIWKIKQSVKEDSGMSQFFKFCVTGGLGTLTNLLIFFILADKIYLPEIPVSVVCFLVAGTQNYIINQKWSFSGNIHGAPLSIKKWLAFLCASLLGLAVNIAAMAAILSYFILPYKFIAQAAGIVGRMLINFIVSKHFVFRRIK